MKKLLLLIGVLGATVAPIVGVVSCGSQKEWIFKVEKYNANRNLQADEFKIAEPSNNILDFNKAADINLYYNSLGSIPYDYMLKLALNSITNDGAARSTKEVHFAYAPNAIENQSRLNANYFEALLKSRNPKSSVINVHKDTRGSIVDEWKKIIEANPTKKINIWWNSDHLDHLNGSNNTKILELAGYKNVNLQLIEDGASITYVGSRMDSTEYNHGFTKIEDATKFDGISQYVAPRLFNNVYSWFSSTYFDKFKTIAGFERVKTFDAKELSDKLFDSRINITADDVTRLTKAEGTTSTLQAGDQRMFRTWPIVSGLDWRNELKTLNAAKAERNVKNLIFLGNYAYDWEDDYIRATWEKYHNDYNIFYKGHPGHNEHSNFVQNVLINQEHRVGMYLLDSAIPSEELTRDHMADGLKFDAVISIGYTSAMDGFPKQYTSNGVQMQGYDLSTQYLEMAVPSATKELHVIANPTNAHYAGDAAATAEWPSIENWLKTSGWI